MTNLRELYSDKYVFCHALNQAIRDGYDSPIVEKTLSAISNCSSFSTIKYQPSTGDFFTFHNRCKNRFCPFCNHFLSVERAEIFKQIFISNVDDVNFFSFTLTVPNLPGLDKSIFDIKKYFSKFVRFLRKTYDFDDKFGYTSNFELTYNELTGAHPHIHAIFSFSKSTALVYSTLNEAWSRICSGAKGPKFQTHFKKLTADDNFFEHFKYSFKFSCFSKLDSEQLTTIISLFSRKKLFLTGGFLNSEFKKIENLQITDESPFVGDCSSSEEFPEKKEFESKQHLCNIMNYNFESGNFHFLAGISQTFEDPHFLDRFESYLRSRFGIEDISISTTYNSIKRNRSI